jgi:hypothetical protein
MVGYGIVTVSKTAIPLEPVTELKFCTVLMKWRVTAVVAV